MCTHFIADDSIKSLILPHNYERSYLVGSGYFRYELHDLAGRPTVDDHLRNVVVAQYSINYRIVPVTKVTRRYGQGLISREQFVSTNMIQIAPSPRGLARAWRAKENSEVRYATIVVIEKKCKYLRVGCITWSPPKRIN